MRLSRVRFSLWKMMVVVAIVGSSLGLLMERRARFSRISLAHKMARDTLPVSDLELFLLLSAKQADAEASPSEKKAWLEAEAEESGNLPSHSIPRVPQADGI